MCIYTCVYITLERERNEERHKQQMHTHILLNVFVYKNIFLVKLSFQCNIFIFLEYLLSNCKVC